MKYKKTLLFVDKHRNELLNDLQTLIKQPSISAKNEGIEECSILVSKMLKKAGVSSEILRLNKNAAPLVFGEVKSKSNPSKTLLFYNHYDVQPVEPLDLWDDPPFSGKIIGNKIAKANADECKEITGFSIGGVSPVAHTHSPSRIFIDEKLNRFDMVYAAAGHPYVVFGITLDNLHNITKGEINSIVE